MIEAEAKRIIGQNMYLTLGTADTAGSPWVTPVFYVAHDYRDFYWVSSPGAQHSQNIAARPSVSIVIFDSTAPIGGGQAVYLTATAGQVPEAELDDALAIYSAGAVAHGGRAWPRDKAQAPAAYRVYRATAENYWVRDPDQSPDQRLAIFLTPYEL